MLHLEQEDFKGCMEIWINCDDIHSYNLRLITDTYNILDSAKKKQTCFMRNWFLWTVLWYVYKLLRLNTSIKIINAFIHVRAWIQWIIPKPGGKQGYISLRRFLVESHPPDHRISTEENIHACFFVVIDYITPNWTFSISKDNNPRTQTAVYFVTLWNKRQEECKNRV